MFVKVVIVIFYFLKDNIIVEYVEKLFVISAANFDLDLVKIIY